MLFRLRKVLPFITGTIRTHAGTLTRTNTRTRVHTHVRRHMFVLGLRKKNSTEHIRVIQNSLTCFTKEFSYGIHLFRRDPVFAKLGLCGIARLNSICTSYARGIIEIPVSRDLMTLRVAHEIGHILGMYHYNGELLLMLPDIVNISYYTK